MFEITIDSKTSHVLVENALEDAIIESSADLENSNDVSNFCDNSDEEVVKIDDFERSNEKVNKFEESILREKCPNTKFFLVRVFPHSD